MNGIELLSEKIGRKQIIAIATLICLVTCENPEHVTIVGLAGMVIQGIVDLFKLWRGVPINNVSK